MPIIVGMEAVPLGESGDNDTVMSHDGDRRTSGLDLLHLRDGNCLHDRFFHLLALQMVIQAKRQCHSAYGGLDVLPVFLVTNDTLSEGRNRGCDFHHVKAPIEADVTMGE